MGAAAQLSFSSWWVFEPATPVTARLVVEGSLKGLRQSLACARRLLWVRDDRLPELLSAVHLGLADRQLYESAVRGNPDLVAQMEREYFDAALWEKRRYANVKAAFTTRPAERLVAA